MGTYFALTDQITKLAEELDRKGQLNKLFERAHAKRNREKTEEATTEQKDK